MRLQGYGCGPTFEVAHRKLIGHRHFDGPQHGHKGVWVLEGHAAVVQAID